jgi:DnaJ-class molecular chaperone
VRIPPGADDGSELRVRGRGEPGPGGGPAGDLVIKTRVRPHPHFRRDGLDLRLRLPVTLDEAYNGGRVEVPTPDGPVEMKVPAHSQPGRQLRLKGKGVARDGRRGDLYVELEVRLPERADPALGEALRGAAPLYGRAVREGIRL